MIRNFLDWLRTAPTEKRQKALILLGLGVIVLFAAVISTVVILKAQKPTTQVSHVAESEASHSGEAHPKGPYSLSYEINQISMAVMNRKGTKTAYAQFSLVLDCPDEESHKTLSMNRAKLLDAIFVVGGGFYLEDFQGEKAQKSFEKFKKDLLQKYQTDFHAQAPREISLKDWFVN
jgi:flagellar basal body-associated protein FliL